MLGRYFLKIPNCYQLDSIPSDTQVHVPPHAKRLDMPWACTSAFQIGSSYLRNRSLALPAFGSVIGCRRSCEIEVFFCDSMEWLVIRFVVVRALVCECWM